MNNHSNVIDVFQATFEEDVLQQSYELPVVVDFWAPWCGPCRTLGPILERLAGEPGNNFLLAKLNVDDNPSLAMQYGVQGIPAVKAFRNGEVVDEFVGAQPEPQVRAFLSRIAPNENDRRLQEAEQLLETREWAEAEAAYRQLSAGEEATFGLAKALLGQGKGCEAHSLLEEIGEAILYTESQRLLPLADYLCRFEEDDDADNVPPIEAQYRRAARLFANGNIAASLDGLLGVLREDKQYDEGRAKEVVIGIFTLLGDEDPLTQQYRPELAMVIF